MTSCPLWVKSGLTAQQQFCRYSIFYDHPDYVCFLLNYVIGSGEQRLRNGQSERFDCLEVDDQLELDRGLDGKLIRRRTLEDSIDIGRRTLKTIEQIISVGEESAEFNEETKRIDDRETVA